MHLAPGLQPNLDPNFTGDNPMRRVFQFLCLAFVAVVLLVTSQVSANAQREKFVISAKAGGINAVTGMAVVHGRGTTEWEQLTIKEDLEAGDVVKTGDDGRVEMLLNPGSYLRVGENSEFELADNSLESLEVKLLRGTAIVEVAGADDTELLINISTPDTRMAIVRRGLYRVNVVPGDSTELIVRKGRVLLEDASHTKVKGGNKVTFTSTGTVSVAKLQKEEKRNVDNLDNWSKERGELVAKANRRIKSRDLSLVWASYNNAWFSGFGRPNGLWYFNPTVGCYTFLPFFMGFGSPYGSYGMSFYGSYSCCSYRRPRIEYPGGITPEAANAGRLGNVGGGNSGGGFGNGGGFGGNPTSGPSSVPSAAEGKAMRANERVPNQ